MSASTFYSNNLHILTKDGMKVGKVGIPSFYLMFQGNDQLRILSNPNSMNKRVDCIAIHEAGHAVANEMVY